ncbi:FF domain protein [Moelleriella libera RCEF 2490]|uniref:FF domain protein n=1 Tax=Moelleriella libera RCEF 2490 TaxID=1081109 RepID=A0A168D597_9HYPO|nr:FF domain protein [Moelleriella libera RCEF 2490]
MLKSTYKPSAAAVAPLPPGWTEHTAPTGHKYYYNASTGASTYHRPGVPAAAQETAAQGDPSPYAHLPSLADPRAANAFLAQIRPADCVNNRGGHSGRGRGGFDNNRPKPQPTDKPRRVEKIPGCEPWMLVYTKYSRRFAYNPVKNASYWRMPEKLMDGILELDKARIRGKAAGDAANDQQREDSGPEKTQETSPRDDLDSDEYEEVEVEMTDDEAGGNDDPDAEQPAKRRKTGEQEQRASDEEEGDEEEDDGPAAIEFTEADIAAQLQAMGEDYGLEPGDYDDGNVNSWPEGTEGVDFSEQDAKLLFKDLLNDYNVNPYSPWEKLMEEGKIVEDVRYTALTTTRARKEIWDEWTREKIGHLKEQRAKQERKDPKVAYMAFLQQKATPKLYWPEFKRKYRKEEPMKDMKMSDKDREKAYREHISRLKLPQATLKSDLTALLKAQPVQVLNSKTSAENLPAQILTDMRYISLDPTVRDPLIEAYIQTLPAPREGEDAPAEEGAEHMKAREARAKRERALEDRNRAVEEGKMRREKELALSKARLREEERALDAAMRVGKRGLQSQLAGDGAEP